MYFIPQRADALLLAHRPVPLCGIALRHVVYISSIRLMVKRIVK